MKELTSENVAIIAGECGFRDEEIPDPNNLPPMVEVEGIMARFGFHPERLEAHRQDVVDMLSQLPDEFQESGGGGMSFLNACYRKDGFHWAEHPTMEMLFALGMGLGVVVCVLPRKMWNVLPGGMPYYMVKSNKPNG